MKIQGFAAVLIAMFAVTALSACVTQAVDPDPPSCQGSTCKPSDKPTEYHIGPGDVLHISVWKDASLDRIVTVRPDGMISYPLLSDLQASGQTPVELQKTLGEKLKQFMADPEVSVVVQEVHSFAVSVLGEVKTPGRYELKGPSTVLDVLALAGGLTPYAAGSRIMIIRDQGGTKKRIPFDYNSAISNAGAGQLFYVQPGDIVTVP